MEVNSNTPNVDNYGDGAIEISGTAAPIAFVGQSNLNPNMNRWGLRLWDGNSNHMGDFSIYDYANSAHRLLINSSGYIGIATTSPGYTLDVAGDGNFSGALTANNLPAPEAGDAAAGKYLDAKGGWSVPSSAYPPPPVPLSGSITPDWQVASTKLGPHGTWLALGRLWVGYVYETPGVIEVYDAATGAKLHTVNFDDSDHDGIVDMHYCAALGKMVALHKTAGKTLISGIDPHTYATSDLVVDSSIGANWGSFCDDGAYFYTVSYNVYLSTTVNGYPIQASGYTGAPDRQLTLEFDGKGITNGHCCRYDGHRIFVTSSDSTPNGSDPDRWSIVAVDPTADWAHGEGVVAASRPAADADAGFTDDLAMVEFAEDPDALVAVQNYLQSPTRSSGIVVCGSELSGKLSVFNKEDLSLLRTIDTGISRKCWGVGWDGRYIWAVYGTQATPYPTGKAAKVSLTGVVEIVEFPPGLENPNEFHTDGTSYYFSFFYYDSAPGKVCAATGSSRFISGQSVFACSIGVPFWNGATPSIVTAIINSAPEEQSRS
ncbi:MAG: hypothetical protein ABSC23_19105 [Bryobacteraceae bacterium]